MRTGCIRNESLAGLYPKIGKTLPERLTKDEANAALPALYDGIQFECPGPPSKRARELGLQRAGDVLISNLEP